MFVVDSSQFKFVLSWGYDHDSDVSMDGDGEVVDH